MNLRVRIDGRPLDLELKRDGETYRFHLRRENQETREMVASLREVEQGIYSVLLEGRSFEARIEPGQAHLTIDVQGHRFAVEVEDPRRLRKKPGGFFGEGRQHLTASMPGKIVRLLVEEGDQVEAGQGLVVVEAMKMQNEMQAPRAGRVVSLPAREGATVGAGDVLATIE